MMGVGGGRRFDKDGLGDAPWRSRRDVHCCSKREFDKEGDAVLFGSCSNASAELNNVELSCTVELSLFVLVVHSSDKG